MCRWAMPISLCVGRYIGDLALGSVNASGSNFVDWHSPDNPIFKPDLMAARYDAVSLTSATTGMRFSSLL